MLSSTSRLSEESWPPSKGKRRESPKLSDDLNNKQNLYH